MCAGCAGGAARRGREQGTGDLRTIRCLASKQPCCINIHIKSISPRPATRTVAPLSDHALALRYAAAQGLADRDDILERILHGALLPEPSYPRGRQGRTEGAQAMQDQRYRTQRACSMELQDLLACDEWHHSCFDVHVWTSPMLDRPWCLAFANPASECIPPPRYMCVPEA